MSFSIKKPLPTGKLKAQGILDEVPCVFLFRMGFDIMINVCFNMCSETGKPFYYKFDKNTQILNRIYEMPSIEVPQQLRKYLVGRGHLFHAYTDTFNERDVFQACADQFLEYYPTWEQVMANEEFRDDIVDFWNEEDHTNFKKLLEWCTDQDFTFQVTWSY
jgi:hypothetical protein